MTDRQQRSRTIWRTLIRPLLILALFVLFVVVWWKVPPALYRNAGGGTDAENARLKAITDTRTALLTGLLGVGALMTFWLNSRLYRVTARSLEVTEQGQITERYSKAVEHLGSEKLDVRLGGIYALERIAVDSERDHSTVVEVLSAFVREHSDPMYRYLSELSDVDRHDFHVRAVDGRYPPELQQAIDYFERQPPPLDVTAAITVLGRLPYRSGVRRGDFSGARLRGVNLEGSDFSGANFSGAVLEGVDFSGAILRNANFLGANLDRADLYFAKLEGASLYNVVGVTKDQLWQADIDRFTQQPNGIHIDPSVPRRRQIRPDW